MNKIKEFFKKFWWLVFIPLLSFLIAIKSKKPYDEVKEEIKKSKEKIKEKDKEIKTAEKEEEKAKEEVKKKVEDIEKVLDDNLEKKEKRDEEAKKFFPGV